MSAEKDVLRSLPSVSELLEEACVQEAGVSIGEGMAKLELRHALQQVRGCLLHGVDVGDVPAAVLERFQTRVARIQHAQGRTAINATGILLHTGLGRSPYAADVVQDLTQMDGYTRLQTSLETGKRCLREEHIERMLQELTGCEAATVVNNNAAATMLILNTVASEKEVVISRGQLIEIGGAFRMTDVMAMSGATLREVGCTNKTHLRDYEGAIGEETGALIHVHTSNYRVRGFSATPDIAALAPLGRKHGVAVVDDLGSGALVPLSEFGISSEPLVADSIRAGADLCCFSGDKLICGPQAGIVAGRKEWVQKVRKNPFARMFRVDKVTLAALEVTLRHFVNGTYREHLPFYQMLSRTPESLRQQADEVLAAAGLQGREDVQVEEAHAFIGSGSIPDEGIPSVAIVLEVAESRDIDRLAKRLRMHLPSVFCRASNGRLYFDLRTVQPRESEALSEALRSCLAS